MLVPKVCRGCTSLGLNTYCKLGSLSHLSIVYWFGDTSVGSDDSVSGTTPLLAALVDTPSVDWQDGGAALRADVSVGAATVAFFNTSSEWQEGIGLGVDGLDDFASALKRDFFLGSRRH